MRPETLTPAAARDGFVTYDELRGPELDAARWSAARLALPTGDEHVPLDPNAEVAVGEGEVRVTIPRFSLSHDRFQFAVDLAVENIGGNPADFRRGMAAFHVFDLHVSKRVFAVVGTATRVLDGRSVYEAPGTLIPERAGIGFGIWTMLPIRDRRSRSLEGQGMNARWRGFRVRGLDA